MKHENLNALVRGHKLTLTQQAKAKQEFEAVKELVEAMYSFVLDAAATQGWQSAHSLLSKYHGREIDWVEACLLHKRNK